jgi:ADP-ribosyl-[dinitrogen reductase] hydrolase
MTNLRTSANDPLRVDFLSAAVVGLPGQIGLTIAPGKRDLPRAWDRDLAADLARLREHFRADVLVSLMEAHEYDALKIPTLRAAAAEAGLDVRWFPIRDVSVPAPGELPAFAALVNGIVASARAGQRVVVHCRGGIGRSGLVAASCLVALGHAPAAAIAATRDARPGAVETSEQDAWVQRYAEHRARHARAARRPAAAPRPARSRRPPAPPPVDRVLGCLLGGALGDALGYPVEFMSAERIAARGAVVPGTLFSDDTQMTLFVTEGLIRAKQRWNDRGLCDPVAVVSRALLRWYATQTGGELDEWAGWLVTERGLHANRAPGTTCLSALAALAAGGDAGTVAAPPNHSKGCGAVMRAAPFGLAMDTRARAFELARDSGVVTHGHPSGYLAGAYLTALTWDLSRGATLPAALAAADALLVAERGHAELASALAAARSERGRPTVADLERIGGGWVGEEALAIALRCVLAHDGDIADTLWLAANHGGDSDSTASIAGNLLGAMHGVAALPAAWLAQLELRDIVERLGRDLHAVMYEDALLDHDAYPPC